MVGTTLTRITSCVEHDGSVGIGKYIPGLALGCPLPKRQLSCSSRSNQGLRQRSPVRRHICAAVQVIVVERVLHEGQQLG